MKLTLGPGSPCGPLGPGFPGIPYKDKTFRIVFV